MNLSREVANSLHPNEAARLRCHTWCPEAGVCAGLEALMLEKLRLFEKVDGAFVTSKTGSEVLNQIAHSDEQTTAPVLTQQL